MISWFRREHAGPDAIKQVHKERWKILMIPSGPRASTRVRPICFNRKNPQVPKWQHWLLLLARSTRRSRSRWLGRREALYNPIPKNHQISNVQLVLFLNYSCIPCVFYTKSRLLLLYQVQSKTAINIVWLYRLHRVLISTFRSQGQSISTNCSTISQLRRRGDKRASKKRDA